MSNTVNRCCHKARVSKNDFVKAAGSRVTIISSVQIGFQKFADLRNLREEFLANTVAFNLAFFRCHCATQFAIIQSDRHLLVKVIESIFDNDCKAVFRVVNFVCAIPEMSGINHTD